MDYDENALAAVTVFFTLGRGMVSLMAVTGLAVRRTLIGLAGCRSAAALRVRPAAGMTVRPG